MNSITKLALLFITIVVLSSCSMTKHVSVEELKINPEHKILSAEVAEVIKEIILISDERIKFSDKNARYIRNKNRIEGISNSDTLVSIKLDEIEFIILEKDGLTIYQPYADKTSSNYIRNQVDAKLFKKRYSQRTHSDSDTTSVLFSSIVFRDEGAVIDENSRMIRGSDKDNLEVSIPFNNIRSLTINKLPKGISKNEVTIRSGLNISNVSDRNNLFYDIDSEVGYDFGLSFSSKFSEKVSAQVEMSYSDKHNTFVQSYTSDFVKTNIETNIKLTYIDISLLSKYKVKTWNKYSMSVLFGPQVGYNISSSGTYDSANYNGGFITGLTKKGSVINLNETDLRIIIGSELDFSVKDYNLTIDFRYIHGLSNIYRSDSGDLLNDVWITGLDGTANLIKNNAVSLSMGLKLPF